MIVYFSNVTNYTQRFVDKLDVPKTQIPLYTRMDTPIMEEPYLLVFPSYGTGSFKRSVPKQTIKFLNVEQNRNYLQGIIGTGNRTFGEDYLIGAKLAEYKTGKPLLYGLELSGVQQDVDETMELWRKIIAT